jgi:hypothetical protein
MSVSGFDVFAYGTPTLLLLAAWSLRPGQPRTVSSRWFIGGANDGLFLLLFTREGLPRKYSWCLPASLALGFILVICLLPAPRA